MNIVVDSQHLIVGVPCHFLNPDEPLSHPIRGITKLQKCKLIDTSSHVVALHCDRAHLRINSCHFVLSSSCARWRGSIPKDAIRIGSADADSLTEENDSVYPAIPSDPGLCTFVLPEKPPDIDDLCTISTTADSVDLLSSHSSESESFFDLYLTFESKVNDVPEGLYRIQKRAATDSENWEADVGDGDTHVTPQPPILIGTALELLFARRVFPCVDSPIHKIPFYLSICLSVCPIHKHLGAHSTASCEVVRTLTHEQASEEVGTSEDVQWHSLFRSPSEDTAETRRCTPSADAYKIFVFQPTPPIATYSLSWFVGFFEEPLELALPNDAPRALCLLPKTCPSRLFLAHWAHSVAASVLQHLTSEVFEGLSPDLDRVAVLPLRLQRGLALENHGLITIKEDYFFTDSGTSVWRMLRSWRLLTHELIHQWIGNVYKPDQVTEVWLKEGLVRYLEFVILDKTLPADSPLRHLLWTAFLVECRIESLIIDTTRDKLPNPQARPTSEASVASSPQQATAARTRMPSPPNWNGRPMRSSSLQPPWSECGRQDSPRREPRLGAQLGSRPIREQGSPGPLSSSDILALYDSVTYNKAAAVLMMYDLVLAKPREWWCGAKTCGEVRTSGVWQVALLDLLREKADRSHLFNAPELFEKALGVMERTPTFSPMPAPFHITPPPPPVQTLSPQDFMCPWLDQPGYPVIHWKTQLDTHADCLMLTITQCSNRWARNEADKNDALEPPAESVWPVPLRLDIRSGDRADPNALTWHVGFVLNEAQCTYHLSPASLAVSLSDLSGLGYFVFATQTLAGDPHRGKAWRLPHEALCGFSNEAAAASVGLIAQHEMQKRPCETLQKIRSPECVLRVRDRLHRHWHCLARESAAHSGKSKTAALLQALVAQLECRAKPHDSTLECPCHPVGDSVVQHELLMRQELLSLAGPQPAQPRSVADDDGGIDGCWFDVSRANFVPRAWAYWLSFGWPPWTNG